MRARTYLSYFASETKSWNEIKNGSRLWHAKISSRFILILSIRHTRPECNGKNCIDT